MGDNLVHAQGPEKTRIERQVTPTLKAQTFTTCSNSIQRNFSGFKGITEQIANAMVMCYFKVVSRISIHNA